MIYLGHAVLPHADIQYLTKNVNLCPLCPTSSHLFEICLQTVPQATNFFYMESTTTTLKKNIAVVITKDTQKPSAPSYYEWWGPAVHELTIVCKPYLSNLWICHIRGFHICFSLSCAFLTGLKLAGLSQKNVMSNTSLH